MRSLEFRDALECPQLDAAGLRNPGEAERVPFRGLMAAVDRSGKYVKMGRCSFSCGKIQLSSSSGVLLDSPQWSCYGAAIRPPGMKWAQQRKGGKGRSFALEIRGKRNVAEAVAVVDMTGVG